MGKVKRKPKMLVGSDPYEKKPLPAGGDAAMEGADGAADAAASAAESVADLTKGQLKSRHHTEWKRLRHSIQELGKEKRRLSNKDRDEKHEKKVLRKHIIELKEEMDARHKREVEAWDRAREEKQREEELKAADAAKPKLSAKDQAALKNMFAHLM
eukprot:TRINITY_DN52545_c0_g1_i1.p2 TRINITY_DN52545_c0_g1~~TRINITY_DN52545_c0_g1_i1.p2  ORF type:complete len:156 (+),score=87.04 TRINITY_DN52545_c0_g1_i1:48-515(+)